MWSPFGPLSRNCVICAFWRKLRTKNSVNLLIPAKCLLLLLLPIMQNGCERFCFSVLTCEKLNRTQQCHNCKRPGHIARECRSIGGGGAGDGGGRRRNKEKCYKCNLMGHFARDCKEEGDRCYRCNETGHIARDCSQPAAEPACYVCNERGHLARNCPTQSEVRSNTSCYNCNKSGHISRNCPDSIRSCYVCGELGHISRECKQNGGRN